VLAIDKVIERDMCLPLQALSLTAHSESDAAGEDLPATLIKCQSRWTSKVYRSLARSSPLDITGP